MKKIIGVILILSLLLVALFLFVSCAKYHDVVFELNGGTMSSGAITEYLDGVPAELPIPTKSGYRFMGWYYSPDFSGSPISVIIPTETVVLYAKFEKCYKINYVTYGGTTSNPSEILSSDTVVLTGAELEGEFFGGWYTDPEFTNPIYVINKLENDIILYAKYLPKYPINYDLAGGVNNPNNLKAYASEYGATLFAPTKNGYDFKGWYDEDGNLVESIPSGLNETISVKATWEEASYSITWQAGAAELISPVSSYRYSDGVPAEDFPTPELNGKIFLYWYRIVNGVEERVTSISNTDYGDFVLIAKWYDSSITYNNIWKIDINNSDTNDAKFGNGTGAITIQIPEELREYADKNVLSAKVEVTFRTEVRSAGKATATASSYVTVQGIPTMICNISAVGGGYPDSLSDKLGINPNKGSWVRETKSLTTNVKLINSSDTIIIDSYYMLESNKKSAVVYSDAKYICESIVVTFYVN